VNDFLEVVVLRCEEQFKVKTNREALFTNEHLKFYHQI